MCSEHLFNLIVCHEEFNFVVLIQRFEVRPWVVSSNKIPRAELSVAHLCKGTGQYPPCWADESGKVEFLFAIELRSDSVVVTPAWPARREADAKALPEISTVLAEAHSYSNFVSVIKGVFNWSKAQDPECRHYVQLKSSIPDAVQSDRARLMVENYFYKVEARR